jgi:3-oxoacyl-(acyl-carrier-protein) synthase
MRNISVAYKDKALLKKEILATSYKNFGRIDNASKMTCYAAALALQDAGIEYSRNRKQDIGIIGANNQGSLETDMNYFKDYLDSNRTSSRGNLFIYTLPTSSLGEAAIRFGLQGPLLYIAASDNSLLPVMDTAAEMILFDESPVMLAGMIREDEAVYFVLKKASGAGQHVLCNIDRAMSILRKVPAFDEMLKEFSVLRKGNNH